MEKKRVYHPSALRDISPGEKIFGELGLRGLIKHAFPENLMKLGPVKLLLLLRGRTECIVNSFFLIDKETCDVWDVNKKARAVFEGEIDGQLIGKKFSSILSIMGITNTDFCSIIEERGRIEPEESNIVGYINGNRNEFFRVFGTKVEIEIPIPFTEKVLFTIPTKFVQCQIERISMEKALMSGEIDFGDPDNLIDTISKYIIEDDKDYTGKHLKRMKKLGEVFLKILQDYYSGDYPQVNDPNFCKYFLVGCILHDLGKIRTDREILHKKGKLDSEEMLIMKKHPTDGLELARKLGLNKVVKNMISMHHENYGGGGYPYGKCGECIPLEARLAKLLDVFEALNANRGYQDEDIDPRRSIDIMEGMQNPEVAQLPFDDALYAIFVENFELFSEALKD